MDREIVVKVEAPHAGQVDIVESSARFRVVCCGRRFGKTTLGINWLIEGAQKGEACGWFAPNYPALVEVWDAVVYGLGGLIRSANKAEHRMTVAGGGILRFWSLDRPDTIRGVKYHRAVVDEASFAPELEKAWQSVILPTLMDYRGAALILGTPNGLNYFAELFEKGTSGDPEYASFRKPSFSNPYIPVDAIAAYKRDTAERVFRQEIMAEFVEDAGGVFHNVNACVDSGRDKNEKKRPGVSYFMGVDLAATIDFTVLTVVGNDGRQVFFRRYNRVDWEKNEGLIVRAAKEYNASVIMDATGVGEPVVERVRKTLYSENIRVKGVKLTNSNKYEMCTRLNLAFERGEIRLMDIPVQTIELLSYEYQSTPGGQFKRVAAPPGKHDDSVVALLLAVHGMASRRPIKVLTA